MDATVFGNAGSIVRNLNPRWYVWQDGTLGYLDGLRYPTWAYPAAGLNSTLADLAKFDAALQDGKLVKRTTLERMWTPTRLANGRLANYGPGWSVYSPDCRRRRRVGHSGGRSNSIIHFVDDGLTVIVLCNLHGADALLLANDVAAHYFDSAEGDTYPGGP
jgi:CubicO group peptidase (beta-lactamase class C family)